MNPVESLESDGGRNRTSASGSMSAPDTQSDRLSQLARNNLKINFIVNTRASNQLGYAGVDFKSRRMDSNHQHRMNTLISA